MKTFLTGTALVGLMILNTGCPDKVHTDNAQGSGLNRVSKSWGVPVARPVTAGFNGSIAQPVDVGPANTQNAPTPKVKY